MKTKTKAINCVLSSACLDRLIFEVQTKKSISLYNGEGFSFTKNELFPNPAIPDAAEINLDIKAAVPERDAENAEIIYGILREHVSGSDATDARFWAYLSHGPLFEYMKVRWPVAKNEEEAVNIVARRWLLSADSPIRAISRNGVSRLWWGAHLTYAPWETDGYFSSLKCSDKYRYTRVLFAVQDVFEGLLGRGLARDRHILIAILEVLRKNSTLHKDREKMRSLFKRMNFESFHTLLGTPSLAELVDRLKTYVN